MNVKTILVGVGIGILIIAGISGAFWASEKFKQIEADSVEIVCYEYYQNKVLKGKSTEFTVTGSHDSEPKDGYGSCDIYSTEGIVINRLECDASIFWNSGNCKTARNKL